MSEPNRNYTLDFLGALLVFALILWLNDGFPRIWSENQIRRLVQEEILRSRQ